jgi:glycosyltransferase involved in cell wall biosynthesis
MPKAIMLEPTNYIDFPVGGQTSFARQMMSAFGEDLALVGFSTDDTPVGVWVQKEFMGKQFLFLSIARLTPSAKKPLIPLRIRSYFGFRAYRKQIMSLGIGLAFTQSMDAVMGFHRWGWKSICFSFAGTANPLAMSRYKGAQYFAKLWDERLVVALKNVTVILASADDREIQAFVDRTGGVIARERIIPFPTRVDTELFHPVPPAEARAELGLSPEGPLVVSCARINRRKGWDLVLDSFAIFRAKHPKATLIYVGDGEDRGALEVKIREGGLSGSVSITGFVSQPRIALYNAACDVFTNGSHFEGWPIAQLEAIACGAPIVSTDVSGARALITEGRNGFVTLDRDPKNFAERMDEAMHLAGAREFSRDASEPYALKYLARDLNNLWPLLDAPEIPGPVA